MAEFLNHNSFLLILLAVLAIAARALFKDGVAPRPLILFALAAGALLFIYQSFRADEAAGAANEALAARIGQGVPVLIEVRSPN